MADEGRVGEIRIDKRSVLRKSFEEKANPFAEKAKGLWLDVGFGKQGTKFC